MVFSFILQMAWCCVHWAAGSDFIELGSASLSWLLLCVRGDVTAWWWEVPNSQCTSPPRASHVGRVWVMSSAGQCAQSPPDEEPGAEQQEQDWGHSWHTAGQWLAGQYLLPRLCWLLLSSVSLNVALVCPGTIHVVCSCGVGTVLWSCIFVYLTGITSLIPTLMILWFF